MMGKTAFQPQRSRRPQTQTAAQELASLATELQAAVNQFTTSLAGEVGRYGINVNAVITGYTVGPRDALVESRRETHPEEYRKRMEHKDRMMAVTPLGRMGTGEDYADAVAFLASDKASYITGHLLRVTGGFPQILEYSSGAIPGQGRD